MGCEIGTVVIVGIVFGSIFGSQIISAYFNSRAKMLELDVRRRELEAQSGLRGDKSLGRDAKSVLEQIQHELSELRQTSGEFDMSINANMEHIQERLRDMERRMQEIEQQQQLRG